MKFFNLKIHCWGGLGSQLYALAIANALNERYKKRKVLLVLHTSGVTQRISELDFVKNLKFEIKQINDFKNTNYNGRTGIAKIIYFFPKLVVKKMLELTGIICTGNSDSEFKKIRPWTLSLRGHYFYRTIEPDFYKYLLLHLDSKITNSSMENLSSIAIHYRMGDLLKLDTKSIYSAEKILEEIKKVKTATNYEKIVVYSDSPEHVRSTLVLAGLSQDFTVRDIGAIDVICECINAGYFIGTNSKISLWIVNLRRYLGRGDLSFVESFDSLLYNSD